MKLLVDGSIDGTPEELAEYERLSAENSTDLKLAYREKADTQVAALEWFVDHVERKFASGQFNLTELRKTLNHNTLLLKLEC